MRVTVTARCRLEPHLRAYAAGRLERLARHNRSLQEIRLVLDGDDRHIPRYSAEAVARLERAQVVARSDGSTLREAIDTVIDRLDRGVVRRKERLSEHKGHAAAGADPAAPGPRPTIGVIRRR